MLLHAAGRERHLHWMRGVSGSQLSPEALAGEVERQGIRVKRTKKGYVAYCKDGVGMTVWHRTPSDLRSYRNTIANLRRIGVDI